MRRIVLKDAKTSLEFNKLVMGSAMCEKAENKALYFSLFDKYFELGGDAMDTARCYCYWMDPPMSAEEVVGEYIKAHGCRKDITLITKGAHPKFDDMHTHRMTKHNIEQDIATSLEKLGTDHADLYLLHRDAEDVPAELIIQWMNGLIQSGLTRMIGVSNWSSDRVAAANSFARVNGLSEFCTNQVFYSLATTTSEQYGDDTLVCMNEKDAEAYIKADFPVMAFTAQAKGFFSKYAGGTPFSTKILERFATDENITRADRVNELAAKYGGTPAAVALAALTCRQDMRCAAVLGASKPEQIADAMTSENIELTAEEINCVFNGKIC